jgi:hypothetical protein
VLARPVDTTPPASHPTAEVRLDLQPTTTAHIEEAARAEVLTLELQLAVAFELLHHFNMVKKSRSLSTEELDLVEFLVTQVASLSPSLAVEAVIVESLSWRWVRRGGALVCSHRSAQLAAKYCGGIFKLLVPHHRLSSKVVSRRRMAHTRSCSMRPDLHFIAVVPPGHSGVSGGFLRSAW